MTENIAVRISSARVRSGLSKSELARKLGVTPQSVQDWESGATRPKADRLNALAGILSVPLHWLAFGEGESHAIVNKSDLTVSIPMLEASASAGTGNYASNVAIALLELSKSWVSKQLNVSSAVNLRIYPVKGDSMEPSLCNLDTVLVDTGVEAVEDDGVYVLRIDDAIYVKRVQRFPGRRLRIISDNPHYQPFELSDGDNFDIVGRVVYSWHGSPC